MSFEALTEGFTLPEVWEWNANFEVAEGLRVCDLERIANTEGLSEAFWKKAKSVERLESLQTIENKLAEIQHRPPKEVVAEKMGGAWGSYNEHDDCIRINIDLIKNPELREKAIETIAHEGRHAYQWHAITHPGFHNNEKEVEYWAANWDPEHYLSGELFGFELYSRQPVELDAFKYGRIVREGVTKVLA